MSDALNSVERTTDPEDQVPLLAEEEGEEKQAEIEESTGKVEPVCAISAEGREAKAGLRKRAQAQTSTRPPVVIMVSHFLAISLPVCVAIPAMAHFSYFSWHPVCMVVAVSLVTQTV